MNKKIISVVSVFWLFSQSVYAEMKQIDDADLSDVTGQAGLTIDIAMGIEIGEFMYKDGGSIVVQGMRLGGKDRSDEVGTKYNSAEGLVAYALDPSGLLTNDNAGGTTGLDNVRIMVDVSGDGSDLDNNGTIELPFGLGTIGIPDNYFNWAWGRHTNTSGAGATGCGDNGTCEIQLGDGDLFIHADYIDSQATEDGRPHTIADFGIEFDAFKLKDSNYIAGDDIVDRSGTASSQSTTLMSNYRMEGYFGGFDLLLENKGNGFGAYDAVGGFTETGSGDAASKIKINTFFEVTEMEYDFDIIGVRYEKMKIHNKRGNYAMFDFLSQDDYANLATVGTSQGYAQSNTHIYSVKDAILRIGAAASANGGTNKADYIDGIAMDSRFIGDMDIGHLSFGDTGLSIGEQYYTDMDFTTNLVLSAH
jgi:hypothetical protein